MAIPLPPEWAALIEDKVARGEFPSADACLREALHQLEASQRFLDETDPKRLRAAYESGMAEGGEPIDFDRESLMAELFARPDAALSGCSRIAVWNSRRCLPKKTAFQ